MPVELLQVARTLAVAQPVVPTSGFAPLGGTAIRFSTAVLAREMARHTARRLGRGRCPHETDVPLMFPACPGTA
jgi:hypothetical protein